MDQVNIYEGTAETYHDATAPDTAVYYSLFARDAAGNWSARAVVALPEVPPADTNAPTTTAAVTGVPGLGGWMTTAQVGLSVDEAATTYFQWDGTAGAWNTYAGPISVLQGSHTLYFNSVDAAGNVEFVQSAPLKVDSDAPSSPSISSASHQNAPSNLATADFSFGAADGVSGVAGYSYAFDRNSATTPDAASEGVGTSVSMPVTADGAWYFHVRALDAAGNWGPAAHHAISVDRTAPAAPVVSATRSGSNIAVSWTPGNGSTATRVLRSTAGYAASPSDGAATVLYDGSATSATDANAATGTTYYYTAFSRDAAGNWSPAGKAVVAAVVKVQPVIKLVSTSSAVTVGRYFTLRSSYLVNGVKATATAPVTVWSNQSGTWAKIGTATYNKTYKTYDMRIRAAKSATYEMRCVADPTREAAVSNQTAITVKGTVVATASTSKLSYGSTARATVVVRALSPTKTTIVRELYSSRTHRWVKKRSVRLAAARCRPTTPSSRRRSPSRTKASGGCRPYTPPTV